MKYATPLKSICLALALFCAACTPAADAPAEPPPENAASVPDSVAVLEGASVVGQTIYVPVYSHIYYHDDRRVINLAATLSIRNTDLRQSLRVTRVTYHDTDGTLVRHYVQQPLTLGPLASKDYVVEVDDTSGGSGANFIVEWSADTAVTDPVVEAVMISTASSQGISFISTGRVIARRGDTPPAAP